MPGAIINLRCLFATAALLLAPALAAAAAPAPRPDASHGASQEARPSAGQAGHPAEHPGVPADHPAEPRAEALPKPPLPSVPHPLTVVSRGGAMQAAQHNAYFGPFVRQTGLALDTKSWTGGIGALRATADSGAASWDVVQVPGDTLLLGCAEGLFETLDWNRLGGKAHYQPQGVSDCGVGTALYDYVLSWDRDKLQGTPTWADFWDVAKYPGKRGLPRSPRLNLEIALMADGVAPGDVYRTLRTADGVDRAFRKLDQLKPYIVWWETDAEAMDVLASGQVLMTVAPNGAVVAASGAAGAQPARHFGMQWNGGLIVADYWAVMKNTQRLFDAYVFLNFAGDPARQAEVTRETGYAGLAKGAGDKLPAEVQAVSSGAPAHLSAGLPVDAAFWRDNLDKLTQRFNEWLAAH